MRKKRALFTHPALAIVAGILLNAYGELVLRTSRFRVVVDPAVDVHVREQGLPVIYALWHCQVFFMPLLRRYERRSLAVLLSQHRDARIVGVAAQLRGVQLVRGSSTRGGLQAYRQLLTRLRQGQSVCVTPDGPKGPARQVKSGVIQLARHSGCVVVPVAWAATRKCELRSWDRTVLPLPFGRYLLVLGPPRRFAEEAGVEEQALQLTAELDALCQGTTAALI
jgi:lysophospholipid acyltransferase (LPLAT)-like uncharacterized protein